MRVSRRLCAARYELEASDAVSSTYTASSGACEGGEAFYIGDDLTDSDVGFPHQGLNIKGFDKSGMDCDGMGAGKSVMDGGGMDDMGVVMHGHARHGAPRHGRHERREKRH